MNFTKYEIELLFRIYPRVNSMKIYSNTEERYFIEYIKLSVNLWSQILYEDELEIIDLRYYKNKSFNHIAGVLGYQNHSSVVRKVISALDKIEKNFYK